MPSREPELYKDKIEVSLDGRQIFYLFFGGATVVGLVFVLGVMIGRRVEARGHLDRADTQTASDPLAALDRLERSDKLSFRGALTGTAAPTDVEKAIGELEKRRGAPEKKTEAKPEARSEARPETRPETKPEVRSEKVEKADAAPEKAEPVTRPEPDKPRGDRHDGEKKPKKHDDKRSDGKADKPARADGKAETRAEKQEARTEGKAEPHADTEAKIDAKTEAKTEAKTDAKPAEKVRFTLQLSSFQDRSEAEAFLSSMKSAGYQPYLTEADVTGKGTFYRVRLGSYRSLEAANDAKAEYEKTARKSAQVMRL